MSTSPIEIIPAVIPKTKQDLLDHIEMIHTVVPIMHIDACDGVFVPSVSWPYSLATKSPHRISADSVTKELAPFFENGEGMPYWKDFDYEIDLMVSHPEVDIEPWILSGAKRFIIHPEQYPDVTVGLNAFFEVLGKNHGFTTADQFDFFELGIALAIDTPFESILPFINHFHFIQCMGISRIGFQGQPFNERVIEKVNTIRQQFPQMPISVDGGVSIDNCKALVTAGAQRLVVGSAVFGHPNGAVHAIRDLFSTLQ